MTEDYFYDLIKKEASNVERMNKMAKALNFDPRYFDRSVNGRWFKIDDGLAILNHLGFEIKSERGHVLSSADELYDIVMGKDGPDDWGSVDDWALQIDIDTAFLQNCIDERCMPVFVGLKLLDVLGYEVVKKEA